MPTATQSNTTPTRRSALGFTAAATHRRADDPDAGKGCARCAHPSGADRGTDRALCRVRGAPRDRDILHIDEHGTTGKRTAIKSLRRLECRSLNGLRSFRPQTLAGIEAIQAAVATFCYRAEKRVWSGEGESNVNDAAGIRVTRNGPKGVGVADAQSSANDILAMGSARGMSATQQAKPNFAAAMAQLKHIAMTSADNALTEGPVERRTGRCSDLCADALHSLVHRRAEGGSASRGSILRCRTADQRAARDDLYARISRGREIRQARR